jgi:hypothetical protein
MILNAAYGKDGMNTEKYPTTLIQNANESLLKQTSPRFLSTRQI